MPRSTSIDPSTHSSLSDAESHVVQEIYAFTETYFQNPAFDASHDFEHVKRVVNNALTILEKEDDDRRRRGLTALKPLTVILGALLHDVEDKKYITTSDGASPVKQAVVDAGLSEEYATQMQTLMEGVSYSSEVKDPQRVRDLIVMMPELAVVQDADRLDAIGAIGIGRCFTFSGAKRVKSMEDPINHFSEKLLKLEGMMKTASGKAMASERSRRIREFMSWWDDEVGMA